MFPSRISPAKDLSWKRTSQREKIVLELDKSMMMTVMTIVMACSQWRGGWRRRRWLRRFARAGWTRDTQRGARRACKENIQDVANLPIELIYLKIVKSETFANHLLAATSPPPWWNPHPLWNEKIVINKIGKRWRFCWSKSSSSNCDQTISVTHGAPTWNNLNLSCHQPPPQHYWFKNQFCNKLLKYWNWLITWIW